MAKRSAARRAEEDAGTNDPSRPDNIPSQHGDPDGGVVDATSNTDVIDVNAVARDDDARPDSVKEEERRQKDEEEQRLQRAADTGDERPARDEDDEETGNRGRRARRRGNRARELDRESDERVTNLTADNKKLKERLAKLERGGNQKELELSIGQMKAQISSLTKDLLAHKEAGKTAEELDVQIKIGEMQARLALAERDLETAKRQPEPEQEDATRGADQPAQKRPQIVDDWLTANRRWWNLPSAEPLRRAAKVIDEAILADIKAGDLDFDAYSDDHMDEMTERLLKEADRLDLDFEINDFNGERFEMEEPEVPANERREPAANSRERGRDVRTNGERRPAAGGMGGRQGNRKPPSDLELARQGKARLGPEDYAQMRVYKLDPNDAEVRKRFAKERVRTILTDARKTGGGR